LQCLEKGKRGEHYAHDDCLCCLYRWP